MVNIGTLSAFALVSMAVPVLRRKRPDLQARVPRAVLARCCRRSPPLISVYLMLNLSVETWIRFLVWMALGFLIYFLYGVTATAGCPGGPRRASCRA